MQEQLDKIEKSIELVEKDLHSIREAIIGNDFGNKGLLNRMEVNEIKTDYNGKQIKEIKSKAAIIGAAFAGAVIGIKELIVKVFGW